jgi:hypothetical protein
MFVYTDEHAAAMEGDVYRCKMGAIYAWLPLLLFVVGFYILYSEYSIEAIVGAAVFWTASIFTSCICLRTRYIFKESGLIIKTMFSEREIRYLLINEINDRSGIGAIHQTGFIYSTDVVHMQYAKNGHIWMAPVRKQEFLLKLRSRCPLAK